MSSSASGLSVMKMGYINDVFQLLALEAIAGSRRIRAHLGQMSFGLPFSRDSMMVATCIIRHLFDEHVPCKIDDISVP